MKYSIIVPIYNSEKTLPRCLDSILQQNNCDAELLLINDGSSDRSEEICLAYARKYSNVICKTTENRGVSAARNLGLDLASGTYILFVDSDDYVEPGYFQKLNLAIDGNSDELIFFSYRITGARSFTVNIGDAETTENSEVIHMVSVFLRRQQLNALWSKVFLRRIIEDYRLRFDTSLDIDEDVNFVLSYALNVNRLRTSKEILYNNSEENADSLTRKRRDYLREQLQHAGQSRLKLIQSGQHPAGYYRELQRALSWLNYRGVYSVAAELLKYPFTAKERRSRLHAVCKSFADYPDRSCHPFISFPVRWKMVRLIDRAARLANLRRRH